MSMYNMLFGVNEKSEFLLKCLGLTKNDIPRFRDCFIFNNSICIYTRTGGGNREEYEDENNNLCCHPNYINDEDDEMDCTYANFFFSFPDDFKDDLKALSENDKSHIPSEKWKKLFDHLENISNKS